jgi:isopropylmalate/homocitrate/citramalate synthase
MSSNKPIFGRNLFQKELGMVVERYYKRPELARELETFDPALFGEKTKIVLGKKSGRYSVMYALRDGRTATDEQIRKIVEMVKAKAVAKKSVISKKEFVQIVSDVIR